MQAFRISWRNLWRNRRRTTITMAAIAFNTAVLIVAYSLMAGLLRQVTENATQLVMGEVQVHRPGYLADRSFYKILNHPESLLKRIRRSGLDAVPRCYGFGLISIGNKSSGARFWGVVPDQERKAFRLPRHFSQGTFLEGNQRKELILGRKLARSLHVKVGDSVVVVVQAADGSLGNDLFRVVGVLKAVGERVDRNAVIMDIQAFRDLFVMSHGIHEIAVNSHGRLSPGRLASLVSQAAPRDEVKTWRQLLPTLSDMLEVTTASMMVFSSIFFLAGGLGVLNTMLMGTYERIPEFGLIKALGASPWKIIGDVALEAWLLALIATTAGALAGIGGSLLLQHIGLDTSAYAGAETTIAGVAFDPVWRASLKASFVWQTVTALWLVCVAAGLYPATVAARLNPVKSIHRV